MRRSFLSLAVAALATALTAVPSTALMVAMKPAGQRALSAEAVVVGKVTSIEKDPVEAAPFANAPNKVAYKVAVVKVETALAGVKDVTHIKVGFIPPPPPAPAPVDNGQPRIGGGIRRPGLTPELKEDQEFVFFLSKHPSANFYVMPMMSPPLDVKAEGTKAELESVKKTLAVIADPMKALKSAKADERAFAAAVMAGKYRSYPDAGGEVDQVPINAEESKLILKGIAESDWAKFDRTAPNGMQSFYSLGLTDKDGWVPPKPVRPQPGQPAVNFNELTKEAFVKWLDGPGKDYVVKKIVPKKK
jgi:hypothetical protein